MNDFEKLSEQLLTGDSAEKIKSLIGTPAAQKIGKMIDSDSLKAASQMDNKDAVKSILSKVLETQEGKSLAAELLSIFDKK